MGLALDAMGVVVGLAPGLAGAGGAAIAVAARVLAFKMLPMTAFGAAVHSVFGHVDLLSPSLSCPARSQGRFSVLRTVPFMPYSGERVATGALASPGWTSPSAGNREPWLPFFSQDWEKKVSAGDSPSPLASGERRVARAGG